MKLTRLKSSLSVLAGVLLFLAVAWVVSPDPDDVQSNEPGVAEASARRESYQKFFAGAVDTKPVVLSADREIRLAGEFDGVRDFMVNNGRVVAVEMPPGSRMLSADVDRGMELTFGEPGGSLPMVDPSSIAPDPTRDDIAWLFDFRTGDFVAYLTATRQEQRRVKLEPALFQPVWADGRVLANGVFSAHFIRTFSADGEPGTTFGASPFSTETPEVAMHLNRSALALAPNRKRIALALLYSNRLEIFDTRGGAHLRIAGPTEINLDYRVVYDPKEGIDRFLTVPTTRYAYVDAVADDLFIYALFSGRSIDEWKGEAGFGETLHVFSWAGELVEQRRLPKAAQSIAIDSIRRRLYALAPGSEAAMFAFDLSSIVPRAVAQVGAGAYSPH